MAARLAFIARVGIHKHRLLVAFTRFTLEFIRHSTHANLICADAVKIPVLLNSRDVNDRRNIVSSERAAEHTLRLFGICCYFLHLIELDKICGYVINVLWYYHKLQIVNC